MVELIEPGTGAEDRLYGSAYREDGVVFHHKGYLIDSETKWAETMRKVDDLGPEVVRSGAVGETIEFAYVDARPVLGHYLEFVWVKNPTENFLSRVPQNGSSTVE